MELLNFFSKEQKETKTPLLSVLQMPFLENEKGICNNLLEQEQKKIGKTKYNIEYLEGFVDYFQKNPKIDSKIDKELLKKMIKIISLFREQFDKNKKRITKYAEAKNVNEIIPKRINLQLLGEKKLTSEKEISENLKEVFKKTLDNIICLANSHIMTFYEITEAGREMGEKKIAVIVFDNHVDMSSTEDFIWKGNIFKKLFDNNSIQKVLFIGNTPSFEIFQENNDFNENIEKIVFEEINDDNIEQINSDEMRTDGKLDRQELIQGISNILDEYKKQSVTNLIFSIDIDVLRVQQMGYTAMEYNPMNPLSYLASLDLPPKKYSELSDDEIKKIHQYIFEDNEKRLNLNAFYSKELCDPLGMALGDIGVCLDLIVKKCKLLGITFGIELKGGGKFLGDIVELSGVDYEERTTKAVATLIKRIEKNNDSL